MANKIYRRPSAEDDLISLWEYIADDNEVAADRLLQDLEGLFKLLAERPLAGRARPELADKLRSMAKGNYVVFYQPVTDGIEIVRVLSRYLDSPSEDFA